jgi:predicted transposase YbfD/YdcC
MDRKKELADAKEPVLKNHTRVFLSSLDLKEKSLCAQAIRGHWSIENRNHHKRDASAWQEDRHRHRKTQSSSEPRSDA